MSRTSTDSTELERAHRYLDQLHRDVPRAQRVVHGEDGYVRGRDADGRLTWAMPAEDYEAILRWEGYENHGE